MTLEQLVSDALRQPLPAITDFINQHVASLFPTRAILHTEDGDFNLEPFVRDGHCTTHLRDDIHPLIAYQWLGVDYGINKRLYTGLIDISWQEHALQLVTISWSDCNCTQEKNWLLADSLELAEAFFAAVCKWNTEIRDEILVFEDGYWNKNTELFQAIKNASFDNLILEGTLKHDVLADVEHFLAARETYDSFGVPWKRGILLIGPPGNGKTHMVKALVNTLNKPCLYVKSLESTYGTNTNNIRAVFDRARQSAPCLLVMEDLDALITDENRSFFLNELDGFAANHGIILLATTNHPERIDAAIVNRPSRFDRKYHFDLPAVAERLAYIQLWNSSLQPATQLSEAGMHQVAEASAEFSFAYLKELFLSSLMDWMQTPQPGAMDKVMVNQIELLREQMISVEE